LVAANYNQAHVIKAKSGKVKNIDVQSFQRPGMISQLGGLLSRKKKKRTYENFFINNIVVAEDRESFYLAMRSEKNFRLDEYKLKSGERLRRSKFDGEDFWSKNQPDGGNQMQWRANSATVSSDGKYFAILDESRKVYVIDAEDESLMHELEGWGESSWPGMYFSPDNTRLFVLAESEIKAYGVESGEEEMSLDIGDNSFYNNRLVFSDDGNRLATIGQNNTVKVFDLENGDEVLSRKCKGTNRAIAISPNGEKLAIGKNNCQFEVWDLEELESDEKDDE
jgi:WD40 repeat protein